MRIRAVPIVRFTQQTDAHTLTHSLLTHARTHIYPEIVSLILRVRGSISIFSANITILREASSARETRQFSRLFVIELI